MARRLQGFFLRVMYRNSLTIRQRSKKYKRRLLQGADFRLDAENAKQNLKKINKVRQKITDMLVQRSIVFSSRAFGHTLAGMRKLQVDRAHLLIKNYIVRYTTF